MCVQFGWMGEFGCLYEFLQCMQCVVVEVVYVFGFVGYDECVLVYWVLCCDVGWVVVGVVVLCLDVVDCEYEVVC